MLVLSHRGNCRHRGNCGESTEPENTLAAFAAAVAAGAEGFETDVRRLGDGALVLHHDRLSPSGSRVSELRREELEGELGHRLATPGEALAAWPDLFWNLEIKAADALEPLLPLLRDAKVPRERLLLTSFLHDLVASVEGEAASYPWGALLVHRPADAAAWAAGWKRHPHVGAMVWSYDFLDPSALAVVAAAGFDNYCYGVQSSAEHRACRVIGLAGVITDFPRRAVQ